MSKFAIFGLLAATGAMVSFASDFPYSTSMTRRYHSDSLTVNSFAQPGVSAQVDPGMPASDTVATVYMDETVITAVDAEDLHSAMETIGNPQAAFALKDTDGTLTWMGYANGTWVALSGVTPVDGQTWWVKIDFDYTDRVGNSSGVRKIRYSLSSTSEETGFTVLKPSGSGDGWIANGALDDKIAGVNVYSYAPVKTGAVGAKSGARAAEGTIAKVEDVSMNYEKLTLSVTATDTWGVKNVEVTLKNGDGTTVDTYTKAIVSGGPTVFDNLAAQVGGTYTYDVKLTGDAYQGAVMEKADTAGTATVKMFSAVDWFGFDGTGFVNVNESEGVTVDSDKGRFYSTDDEIAGTITPTTSSVEGARTVVTSVLYVDGVISESDLPTFEAGDVPQFAIAIATDNGGTRHWYYFDGTWKQSSATLATANGTYTGEATFDYADAKTVSYRIKEGGLDSTSAYVVLVTDVSLTSNRLDCVQVQGSSFGNMNAYCKTTEPPPVKDEDITAPAGGNDGQITLRGNTEVGLDKLGEGTYGLTDAQGKKGHLKWSDKDGKIGKMDVNGKLTVKSATIKNGIKSSYDSYVLGLDPEEETDRPAAVVKSNLSSDGDGIVVNVPNLMNVRTDLGYTVKLRLEVSTDGGKTWNPSGTDVDVGAELTVPLFENAGKLYRVNTIIK